MRAQGISVRRGRRIFPFALGLFLAACGGAGGGGDAVPVSALALLAGDMGGKGTTDGTGVAARFNFPTGMATDSAGNIYVADADNHTVRKITPAGVVSTLAGAAGFAGSDDSVFGATATFNTPSGVAIDSAGNVYVADTHNHTIRKITLTPNVVVSTFAGMAGISGSTDATGLMASFNLPSDVASDGTNVYVADTGNNTIRKITPAGVVSTFAGTAGAIGSTDATGAAASFNQPLGVATDGTNVYVADTGNNTIRKITPSRVVSTLAGTAGVIGNMDGTGPLASFFSPGGVATDGAANVYVADSDNDTIRNIVASTGAVSTLAGTAGISGAADGVGAAAGFNFPQGIATSVAGTVYVADTFNNTIRAISPDGVVGTLAGTAGAPGSGDGVGPAASFNSPSGVATDVSGNVYVADANNSTIRVITPDGVVSTLAGTAGISGSVDGTGPAASFNLPSDVATDSAGNVYVADTFNNTIRLITPAGVVTTLAGDPTRSGFDDGNGNLALFQSPRGIATDSMGNVYVADTANNTIRQITPVGDVITIAGSPTAPFGSRDDPVGNNARFHHPTGISIDSANNLYVVDSANHTIRKITPAFAVSTVVGMAGRASFLPGALPGLLAFPTGVAVSGTSLYITLNNGVAVVSNRP